jgi:hypothetical protein
MHEGVWAIVEVYLPRHVGCGLVVDMYLLSSVSGMGS